MAIHQPLPGLYLIDLDQAMKGFRRFIGAWVLRRGNRTVLVDPGPRSTIPVLFAALDELGVGALDALLLTHIHIDHAGGAGLVAERYPEARVVCHPEAVRHLVEPAKLWAGSLKILGSVARAYGEIAPVPSASLGFSKALSFGDLSVTAVETPGHASHHLSFLAEDLLFGGEVAGVTYPLDGERYLRLATPPVFAYEIFRSSLERARMLPAAAYCFGHYGLTRDPAWVFDSALGQLDLWLAVVERNVRSNPEAWEETAAGELLLTDPRLAAFRLLPADVQARERRFLGNSLRGIRQSLATPAKGG